MNVERRFVALDSWRGIAASVVALFHLDAYSHFYDLAFLRNGWLFVDFFFVLSGFIIAANYEQRLRDGFGAGRFILLRLGRLYPLHIAMLALFVAFALLKAAVAALMPEYVTGGSGTPFANPARDANSILGNVLLVHGLHLYDSLTWNVPSWSISTEFYTYVAFAACILTLRRHAWIALAFALIGGPVMIATLSERNMNTTYDWGMIRCIYGFAAGVLVWHMHEKWQPRFGKWISGSVAEYAVALVAVGFVAMAGESVLSVAAPYVFALVVLVYSYEAGTASWILRRRPLVFLGAISYSIYMTHVFVGERLFDGASALNKLWHINPFTRREIEGQLFHFLGTQLWHGDLAYPVYLAVVIAVSCVTFYWIEKPAREWVRHRVQGRRLVATVE